MADSRPRKGKSLPCPDLDKLPMAVAVPLTRQWILSSVSTGLPSPAVLVTVLPYGYDQVGISPRRWLSG
jgi:hypothetical protein